MVGGSARRRRRHALKTQALQIQLVDEDIDHPDRIILGHIIIETFGKQRRLPAVCTLNEAAHTHLLLTPEGYPDLLDPAAFSHSLDSEPTFKRSALTLFQIAISDHAVTL